MPTRPVEAWSIPHSQLVAVAPDLGIVLTAEGGEVFAWPVQRHGATGIVRLPLPDDEAAALPPPSPGVENLAEPSNHALVCRQRRDGRILRAEFNLTGEFLIMSRYDPVMRHVETFAFRTDPDTSEWILQPGFGEEIDMNMQRGSIFPGAPWVMGERLAVMGRGSGGKGQGKGKGGTIVDLRGDMVHLHKDFGGNDYIYNLQSNGKDFFTYVRGEEGGYSTMSPAQSLGILSLVPMRPVQDGLGSDVMPGSSNFALAEQVTSVKTYLGWEADGSEDSAAIYTSLSPNGRWLARGDRVSNRKGQGKGTCTELAIAVHSTDAPYEEFFRSRPLSIGTGIDDESEPYTFGYDTTTSIWSPGSRWLIIVERILLGTSEPSCRIRNSFPSFILEVVDTTTWQVVYFLEVPIWSDHSALAVEVLSEVAFFSELVFQHGHLHRDTTEYTSFHESERQLDGRTCRYVTGNMVIAGPQCVDATTTCCLFALQLGSWHFSEIELPPACKPKLIHFRSDENQILGLVEEARAIHILKWHKISKTSVAVAVLAGVKKHTPSECPLAFLTKTDSVVQLILKFAVDIFPEIALHLP